MGEFGWQLDGPTPATLNTNMLSYISPLWTHNQEVQLGAYNTTLDWYKLFSSREWLDHVEQQTRA